MPYGDPLHSCTYWPVCGCGLGACQSLQVLSPMTVTPHRPAMQEMQKVLDLPTPVSPIPPGSHIDQLMKRVDLLILLASDLKERIENSDKKMDAVWNGQNLVQQGLRELAEAMRTVGLTGYSKRKGDVFAIKGAEFPGQGGSGEDEGSS
jgi:hypothetical protein